MQENKREVTCKIGRKSTKGIQSQKKKGHLSEPHPQF